MSEFDDKLNAILSSPQAMGQIMALADSLSDAGKKETDPPPEDSTAPAQEPEAAGPDLGSLGALAQLMHDGGQEDGKTAALLAALRPFLKEPRREKLDRAIQIARMTRLVRAALQGLKGGEP